MCQGRAQRIDNARDNVDGTSVPLQFWDVVVVDECNHEFVSFGNNVDSVLLGRP
jgi:hypothetical protein